MDARDEQRAVGRKRAVRLCTNQAILIKLDIALQGIDAKIISLLCIGSFFQKENIVPRFTRDDVILAASKALEPGGLLVFTNPLRAGPSTPSLKLAYRQTVDLGGFDCQLEIYRKQGCAKGLE